MNLTAFSNFGKGSVPETISKPEIFRIDPHPTYLSHLIGYEYVNIVSIRV